MFLKKRINNSTMATAIATSVKSYYLIDAVMTVDIASRRQIAEHMTFATNCYLTALLRDGN